MLTQCCTCKRIETRGGWHAPEPCDEPAIIRHDVTHGYCPRCARRFKRECHRYVARRKAQQAAQSCS